MEFETKTLQKKFFSRKKFANSSRHNSILQNNVKEFSYKVLKFKVKVLRFLKLHAIFPSACAPSASLILNLLDVLFIGEWRFFQGGAYLKLRRDTHTKFQDDLIVSFQITVNNCHFDM